MEESMEGARRTLAILRAVNARRGKWFGVTEIASATGLPKGTTHRYLTVFVDEGILQHEQGYHDGYAVAGSIAMVHNLDKVGENH